jgi:hypothetical protein
MNWLLSILLVFGVVNALKKDIMLESTCSVVNALKVDCGYSGITETECRNRNCCYVQTSVVGVTWCFNPVSDAPTVAPSTFAPSISLRPSRSPTMTPTRVPSVSFHPTTLHPTIRPTVAPTEKTVTHSAVNVNQIVIAMIIIGLVIVFILVFLCLSLYSSWGKAKESKAATPEPVLGPKKVELSKSRQLVDPNTLDEGTWSFASVYPSNASRFSKDENDSNNKRTSYNRRDLYAVGQHRDEPFYDENNEPQPISWYEDKDHGFVN